MLTLKQRFEGSMLGLALGDAFNAPHEGGPIERFVWLLIGRTLEGKRRYTDDTQMSLDLLRSMLDHDVLDLDDVAERFAQSYRWSRGYGPGAAKLLGKIRRGGDWRALNETTFPGGSWGNGGAMRAPVVGLRHVHEPDAIIAAARDSARITHAHELGMQGAAMIASATAVAAWGEPAEAIVEAARSAVSEQVFVDGLDCVSRWLDEGEVRSAREIREALGCEMTAARSCPAAIYVACAFLERDFEAMIAHIAACGGDVDTVGAMAGAIWGAWRGVDALPQAWLARLEDAEEIRELASQLAARSEICAS